jgi:hypothetical protein
MTRRVCTFISKQNIQSILRKTIEYSRCCHYGEHHRRPCWFLPRVTVEAREQIKPLDPFSIHFIITNEGMIPLFDIEPATGVCHKIRGDAGISPVSCKMGLLILRLHLDHVLSKAFLWMKDTTFD